MRYAVFTLQESMDSESVQDTLPVVDYMIFDFVIR